MCYLLLKTNTVKMKYCNDCDYSTKKKSNMDRHIMRWHGLSNKNSKERNGQISNIATITYNRTKSFANNVHIKEGFIDIRLKENFKLFVSGPSRCGKTVFVAKLIENIQSFAKQPPTLIIYVYKV